MRVLAACREPHRPPCRLWKVARSRIAFHSTLPWPQRSAGLPISMQSMLAQVITALGRSSEWQAALRLLEVTEAPGIVWHL